MFQEWWFILLNYFFLTLALPWPRPFLSGSCQYKCVDFMIPQMVEDLRRFPYFTFVLLQRCLGQKWHLASVLARITWPWTEGWIGGLTRWLLGACRKVTFQSVNFSVGRTISERFVQEVIFECNVHREVSVIAMIKRKSLPKVVMI